MLPNFRLCWIIWQILIFFTAKASESFANSNSGEQALPRGIYHYSDTDREIEARFKIPDFQALDPIKVASELMASAVRVDTKRKSMAGFEMPFSLTGKPMSLKVDGESRNQLSLIDSSPLNGDKTKEAPRRSDMSSESRAAFLSARQICLEQSTTSCDEALDTFHRLRFGKSLIEESEDANDEYNKIIEKKLKELELDTTTKSALRNSHTKSLSFDEDPFRFTDLFNEEFDTSGDNHGAQQVPFSRLKYQDKAKHFLSLIN